MRCVSKPQLAQSNAGSGSIRPSSLKSAGFTAAARGRKLRKSKRNLPGWASKVLSTNQVRGKSLSVEDHVRRSQILRRKRRAATTHGGLALRACDPRETPKKIRQALRAGKALRGFSSGASPHHLGPPGVRDRLHHIWSTRELRTTQTPRSAQVRLRSPSTAADKARSEFATVASPTSEM